MPKLLRLTLPTLLLCAACLFAVAVRAQQQQQLVRETASPAAPGSGQSNLAVDKRGRVYLSWIERLEKNRFALRFATREGAGAATGWSAPRTIAEGANWFVNWADFPSIAALPDGSLAAHWLVKSGPSTYAYDVHVSRSFDGGLSWSAPHVPHRDGTQTEHGFVSMFPAKGGRLAAVWLDGREMKTTATGDGHSSSNSGGVAAPKAAGDDHGHGQMTLRYATLGRERKGFKIADEALLDARVCECCQTSAALTSEGPVVVYRDRSDTEMRDISIVRLQRDGRWSAPATVHADNWRLDGCPVNGPSVAAAGRRVAVAWFTLADTNTPHVRLAFSRDAGASFSPPVKVDDGDPVGRADVLLLDDGSALVSWIERTKGGAEVRARRVHPDGRRGDTITVAPSGAARSSGFPQMIRTRERIIFSWTGTRVFTAEMPVPPR